MTSTTPHATASAATPAPSGPTPASPPDSPAPSDSPPAAAAPAPSASPSPDPERNTRTLVLGATGKTGRRVADRLRARAGVEVRAASRSGAGPERFSWSDPGTWDTALAGVDSLYLVYMPELVSEQAPGEIAGLLERARASGTRRVVMLSGYGFPDEVAPAERAVTESGLEWTVLVPHWFMQNFSEDFLLEPVRAGLLELPAGDGRAPFVDVEDIADVAVAALTEGGHHGQYYHLSGDVALGFAEMAAEISSATGRDVRYRPQEPAAFVAGLRAFGLPEATVDVMARLMELLREGESAEVFDGVRRVLGRAPRGFGAYVRATAPSGVWSPEGAAH